MGRLIALVVAMVLGALIAWRGEQTPEPRPVQAPAADFSAGRAMADIEVIAVRPHPIGSAENRQVRDYLVGRLRALGLEPYVRRGPAFSSRERDGELRLSGVTVENVIGVLPGRDRRLPAVALMAHYDSVANSPGAADDATGVAVALEVARALQARGTPARDVMLVITDGEEVGLHGARAFFAGDPLAGRVGFVLNMEARGNGGRVQMFETGRGNGETIRRFQAAVGGPSASSLSTFIYEQMPNGTDFTLPKDAGLQGLNFAFVGRQFDYHSPTSTAGNLDQGSVQEMGDQVLAATASLVGAAPLPAKAPDLVYSQVPGGWLIAYPPLVGWVVLVVAAALVALGAWRARQADELRWMDAVRGAAALLFALLGAIAVLGLARKTTGVGAGYFDQSYLLAQASRWEAAVLLLGLGFLILATATAARGRWLVAALPLAAGLGAYALDRGDLVSLIAGVVAGLIGLLAYWKPAARPGAWVGVLIAGLALATVLQALTPTIAHVVAWPLMLGAIGAAATDMATRRGGVALALLAVLAAAALGFAGGYAHTAFLSLDVMALQALPILMAAFTLWPLAQPAEGAPPARLLGPALLAAGAAVTLWVRFDEPWTARHPQLSYVQYHVDQDAGRAWRIGQASIGPAWTRAVLGADGGSIAERRHWMERQPFQAAPARMVRETPALASLVPGPDGRQVLRVAPPPGARLLALQLRPSSTLSIERVAGLPASLTLNPGKWSRIWWEAEPAGVEIVLRGAPGGTLEVRHAATLERWPVAAKPLPPRPAELAPFHTSDSTVVTGTRRFTW